MKPSIILIFCLFLIQKVYSDNSFVNYNFSSDTIKLICEDVVPYYLVDLEGHPDSTWVIEGKDVVKRDGQCCISNNSDSTLICISFNVYLDANAVGLIMDVKNPAPSDSAFYKVNCGTQIPLGELICLAGGEPYTVTFCNPGDDRPDYIIQSVAGAITTDSLKIDTESQCTGNLHVEGLENSTISWGVKYPAGSDSLLSYLDLTDIENPVFNPGSDTPSLIIYEVCGTLLDINCEGFPLKDCSQVNVFFNGCNSLIMTDKDLNFDTENELLIYPNPGSGIFTIEAGNENSQISSVEIFDSGGLLVKKKDFNNSFGILKVTLDLSNKPSGMYYLRIIERNKPFTKNFVIEKNSK